MQQLQPHFPAINIAASSTHKMDILFSNSIKRSRRSYIYRCILHIIKLLLICIFLPIDVTTLQSTNTIIIAFMGTAIAIVVLNLIITYVIIVVGYGNNKENNRGFVRMAAQFEHVVEAEEIKLGDFDDFQNCVSKTIYNRTEGSRNDDPGLTPQIRAIYQSRYEGFITSQVLMDSDWLSCIQKNGKFCSFSLLIFGIVALSIGSPNSAQIGVLVTFLVLQALNIWIMLLIFILIALSPLIIVFLCIFCCCCAKGSGQVKMPASVQATPQIIQKTDGSCSICFQSFIPKQEVIILPCSQKHVFHQGCINKWIMMAHTCPLCRKNINQM